MPAHLQAAPEGARAVLDEGLNAAAAAQRLRASKGGPVALPDNPALEGPFPLFTLPAEAVARGEGAGRAFLAGWRYLILEGGTPTKAADLSINEDGTARFAGLSAGPSLAGIHRALKLARTLPGDYEARLLRVPGLAGQALWAHDAAHPGEDRFFLLPLVFPPLVEGRAYTAAELIPVLHAKAARIAAQPRPAAKGATP